MKILYIDESGDTNSLSQAGSKYFVLSGCVIDEKKLVEIDNKFREIKRKYYQDESVEIKSNFLRYANPSLAESSPIKLHSKEQYDSLEKNLSDFLKEADVCLLSVVIDKEEYWKKYPSQDVYDIAYIFLLERFQMYLKGSDSLGICIIDPREGQVDKSFIGNQLNTIHERMRRSNDGLWYQCENIVEKLLFSTSDTTNGIQIVDLLCYPIYHVFEYNKCREEYWRYKELSGEKLYRKNGRLEGIGLKFFPDKKKKGLKFFN